MKLLTDTVQFTVIVCNTLGFRTARQSVDYGSEVQFKFQNIPAHPEGLGMDQKAIRIAHWRGQLTISCHEKLAVDATLCFVLRG